MITSNPHLVFRNMCLPAYANVFVDNLLGLSQGTNPWWSYVWRTFLHALEKVFLHLDHKDEPQIKEVLYIKKLETGDWTW